jgi:hypothetical protein
VATIDAVGAKGERYQIDLEKTGDDTGKIRVKTWETGSAPPAPPTKEHVLDVLQVKVSKDGHTLACKADFFIDPKVTCMVQKPVAGAAPARIQVQPRFGSPLIMDFTLSDGEYKELVDFIGGSKFPVV